MKQAPLGSVRNEIDDKDLIKDAEHVGGRPAYTSEIGSIVGM